MPRASSIRRLPREVQERIAELRDQGRTIEEILAKLRELDVQVSRSALGRHLKTADEIGERIRRSREIADVLVRRFGEAPENRVARMNIELMHSVVTSVAAAAEAGGESVELKPMEVMLLAKAIDHLAKAEKASVDVALKAREEATKQAADIAERAVRKRGLSKDAAREIRKQILGLTDEQQPA